jgi:hypothetical protein
MGSFGLKVDGEKRASKFITEVLNTGMVYYLKSNEFGGAEDSESNDFTDKDGCPATVIPFWSKSFLPYAKKWGGLSQLQELLLKDFVTLWLTGMNKDNVVVGLNWDQNGIGHECLPTDLLKKLK